MVRDRPVRAAIGGVVNTAAALRWGIEIEDTFRAAVRAAIAAVRAGLGLIVGLALLGGVAWLLGLRGLHGRRWWQWLAVPPLLLGALACVAGPGRLFPKGYEGPQLVRLSTTHAVTALDLVGAAGVLAGALLAGALLRWRWSQEPLEGGPHGVWPRLQQWWRG